MKASWWPVLASMLLFGPLVACGPGLEGTWSGNENVGQPITVQFRADGHLEMSTPDLDSSEFDGATFEYEVLNEVDPKQLYWVLVLGDSVRHRAPLGIYKIENGRLVVCMVQSSQPVIGLIPFGKPSFEWPSGFSGDCFALDRTG